MIRLERPKFSGEEQTNLAKQKSNDPSERESDIVTFDHPSVKRFLYSSKLQQSGDDRVSTFYISEKTVNTEFTVAMVDHLLAIQQPTIDSSILLTTPFLSYAAQYWHEHLRDSGTILDDDELLKSKLLTLFDYPMSPSYLNWIRIWDPERRTTDFELASDRCPSPLYMSIFLRLGGISDSLVDKGSYINGTGGVLTTLQLATQREETTLSEKLLAAGEDIDKTADDEPTALYIAVDNGSAKLVKILLEAGANPDTQRFPNGSALQLASLRGSTGIAELLVASGADVNLQSGLFGTALQAAAANGNTEILTMLLGKGAEPDAVGGLLGTAIQAAETGGHSEAVNLLAAQGIGWDGEGDSVWHEAYDLWMSQTSVGTVAKPLLLNEPLLGSRSQKMLAGALKMLNSPLPDASNAVNIKRKGARREWEAAYADRLKMAEFVQTQGQMGMENKHYVSRASFWAMLLQFKLEVS